MSLPDQTPKLPKYPFLLADAGLLGAAVFIATRSPGPLGTEATLAIVACVAVGGLLAAVPFLADYARKQDEALDERQRGLDALSRTVNETAEQISIAASGLHQIAELAQRNLKHAEHLPQKLHEKIAEFQAQLDNAREDDREQLEKELEELRAAEGERLEAAAEKIARAIADLTKLESVVQKHLAAAQDAAAQPPTRIVTAIENATNAAVERLAQTPAGDSDGAVARIREAQDAALMAIETALRSGTSRAMAAIESALSKPIVVSAPAIAAPAPMEEKPALSEEMPAPRRRPRARREEITTEAPPAEAPVSAAPETDASVDSTSPVAQSSTRITEAPAAEPAESAPSPVEVPAQVEPVAQVESRAEPPAAELPEETATIASSEEAVVPETTSATEPITSADQSVASSVPPVPEETPDAPAGEPKPELAETEPAPAEEPAPKPRKRAAKPSSDLTMELPADDFSQTALEEAAGPAERVISSDGATRLLVTAYIGIGNRLFVRGEGPGLSEEKGVPLQFVSIGKWRWETTDATAPVRVRIFKNDTIECPGLGALAIDPGHQAEVTAKF